jgi:Transposase and inactivated derivatives, IS30 family
MSEEKKRGTRLDDAERQQISLLRAQGKPPHAIGKILGRSENTVKSALKRPEIAAQVKDFQTRLAGKLEAASERVLDAITDEDVRKAGLKEKALSSCMLIDKARLLRGQSTDNIGVMVRLVREACESAPLPPCPVLPDGSMHLTDSEE